jgi:hypothetical protein
MPRGNPMPNPATYLQYESRPLPGPRLDQSQDGAILTFPVAPLWQTILLIATVILVALVYTVGPIVMWFQFNRVLASLKIAPAPVRFPHRYYLLISFFWLIAACVSIVSWRKHRQAETWQVSNGRLILHQYRWAKLRRNEYAPNSVAAVQMKIVRDVFGRSSVARLIIIFSPDQLITHPTRRKLTNVAFAQSAAAALRKALNLPECDD